MGLMSGSCTTTDPKLGRDRAHNNNFCNDIADHFAKVATTNGAEVSVPDHRSYVIKTLQNKLIEDWVVELSWWSNSNAGLRVKFYFPKPSLDNNPYSSYVTQFLTSHVSFVSYLHRIKLKTTPSRLCGSIGDADHYVLACPLTKDFYLVSPHLKMLKRPGFNLL
ncbi:RNase H domain-containing protein [Trichonephila clavipes]|nr:RNase H domain-containing protein [Trichonephila clavipes]